MTKDISKKSILILVVIALIVSTLSTIAVLDRAYKVPASSTDSVEQSNVQNGYATLTVPPPPPEVKAIAQLTVTE